MCAEGVAVMEGAVGASQPSYSSGMANVDEEITAMLQSSHASLTQASLVGVVAPAVSAGPDLLTSYPYSSYQGGYVASHPPPVGLVQRTKGLSRGGVGDVSGMPTYVRPPPSRAAPSQRLPTFNREEKYVLEAKTEVLDASLMRNGATFNARYENSGPPAMDPPLPMLHRYHSAPAGTFLAELHHEGSLGNTVMSSLFPEGGLTSITEHMDVDRTCSGGSNLNEFEQFLSTENDFGRRAALSALGKEDATPDRFGNLFQASRGALLRQTSSPAATMAKLNIPLQDRNGENGSEESSSRTSDDNNHLVNGYTTSLYSQEDFLLRDTMNSWKSPTSPAKRQRGVDGESETSSGSAEGSTYRNGQQGGLVRHVSLPTTTGGPTSPGVEDHSSFGTIQMRTRAKRGCATHPRSIAERVRRTKISERMKKLQDLVPNMDKQTNTSDMLDETVEYVKSLQMKVQELTETVAELKSAQQKS